MKGPMIDGTERRCWEWVTLVGEHRRHWVALYGDIRLSSAQLAKAERGTALVQAVG